MNILENKRVVALSAVFALAFGGLAYYGYGRMNDFSAAKSELEQINNRVLDFEQDEFPPTEATRKTVKAASKKVADVLKEVKADFASYAVKCHGDGKQISSVDFTNQVRGAIDDLAHQASEKGCTVSPSAADLGMASYKNAAATAEEVPYRSFQLKAAKRVADIIIDSGSPLLDKVYCAPLPDAKLRKKNADFPLSMEVAFIAKRAQVEEGKTPVSVLPEVLNRLVADKDFFYKVTGVWVVANDVNLPGIDAYQAPTQDPNQGDDLNTESSASAAEEVRRVAVRKTGSPDETVRVHLNLQVLYFNPNTSKK
ncbi:MAG: Amuc_1100 family pilus-like protein [Akkermansia sp.]|nr:Amuc_1100 family pilus-like protein [Akkermansia sp.]